METPSPTGSEPAPEEELPRIPESLWAKLRAEPFRAAEHIALYASDRHGPAAAAWAAQKRALYAYDAQGLARMARKRHANIARASGAATGLGGVWTMIPDLAALAWIQSRMVFFIAAAYGYDPLDPMRPAELLVLQDWYPDPQSARAALDGIGTPIAVAYAGSRLSGGDELLSRLVRLVGMKSAEKVGRKLIPGLASIANALTNSRETNLLGEKAMRFYGGG